MNQAKNRIKSPFRDRAVIIIAALLTVIVVLTAGVLYSCMSDKNNAEPLTKEELIAYINEHPAPKRATSVEEILVGWRMPTFTKNLLLGVERCYNLYYYKELPEVATLAYDTAMNFINEAYDTVNMTDPDAVANAIIQSYIAVIGDPYSYYRTADEYEDYEIDMSGQFAGIGVSVETSLSEGGILVINAIAGSPAEKAGIQACDIIVKVGDDIVSELGYDDAVSRIKGEIGTIVKITVLRDGVEITYDIERALITENSVGCAMLQGNIAYLQIASFKSNAAVQFKEAIDWAESNGAVGIIFDVRYNPGGYVTTVCNTLSYIVPTGTPLASFTSDKSAISATHGTQMEPVDHTITIPIVVICNRYTASAGELFTSAIRDFNDMGLVDAIIIGETTYKKGVMQSTISFENGAALTLTTAYYNSPLGINYDGIGIVPDVELDEETDFIEAAYRKILEMTESGSN
jgi:carboxyl-terminal processing protease